MRLIDEENKAYKNLEDEVNEGLARYNKDHNSPVSLPKIKNNI